VKKGKTDRVIWGTVIFPSNIVLAMTPEQMCGLQNLK
jgi:hypothetical protein